MDKHKIAPEKITRPFQLLAAWLTGLIVINGSFLAAAVKISIPTWAPSILIIASVVNVPIFLFCIFLLQTKFRPEMQEDKYYSEYLARKSSAKSHKAPTVKKDDQLKNLVGEIFEAIGNKETENKSKVENILQKSEIEKLESFFGGSRALAELSLRPYNWPNVVARYHGLDEFDDDIWPLVKEGLVEYDGTDIDNMKITNLGTDVAELAKQKGSLFEFFD